MLARLLVALMLFCSPALAQETLELYAPPPPKDAAYVRVIETSGKEQAALTLGSVTLPQVVGTAGAYALVTEGEYKVGELPIKIEAAHAYTLVIGGTTPVLLEDPVSDNPAKALLIFYNLTPATELALTTADGKTEVLTAVAPNTQKSRAVNGISAALGVRAAAGQLSALPATELSRGRAYSIIATGSAEQPTVQLVENKVDLPE